MSKRTKAKRTGTTAAEAQPATRTQPNWPLLALGVVGMLAVEMFDTGDELLVNELAMRPHNSGHQTINANHVHVDTIASLKIG